MADKLPKDMTDEELDKILEPNQEVKPKEEEKPDDKPEAKPPVKDKVEKPEPPEEEEAEEAEPEEEPKEEEKPPSRRETLRVQQLLQKLKEAKPVVTPAPVTGTLDYEKTLDADPALIKQLSDDRQRSNDENYQRGIAQANSIRFHTRLEIDAPKTEAKYPQLDESNKDKFNPVLANAVNSMYLSTVGYDDKTDTAQNPDIRYSDYVDSIFELADEIAGEKVEKTKENIKKQAAKTGLRPDGSGTKKLDLTKLPFQMSDEELDAKIAQAFPQ